ncbi:hypothetical protein C666_10375 [Thauera linaloolentis 47Lol = DSM 12138]|uniref:Uncharacterized protein n=1 Tax=Thauera linaloolentis (strain DSM 12138 / JCM 21573 / CCUG 41526 / CIP 105981 / IAM 15112 / NBRC 102519 / 47Lol) TaxID=1123367 RepID=N6YZZ8_THAL4|nr:hypothetical protein C666_10375 [Thauera linaloolentis 47Lol = DSM 12138]
MLCATVATGCASLPDTDAGESGAAPHADAGPPARNAAAETLQAAIGAARPRQSNLPRARNLLQGLLSAEDPDSLALQPYARALLEQIQERQRLAGLNDRLGQQLERSAAALKDSEQRNESLQRKLDALVEIERSLAPPALQPSAPRTLPQ